MSELKTWTPPGFFPKTWQKVLAWTVLILFAYLGSQSIELRMDRLIVGFERFQRFVSGFLNPDFRSRGEVILEGIIESLTMTVVATVMGVLFSIPVALGGASNISSTPVYIFCRGLITISRTFQEVIIAILFVAMVGFGPFAGVLTLAFASVGFLAKLLAEDIEEIQEIQLEALRSTGARWPQVISYAVFPQIRARVLGLSLYRLDINFRESSVIGIVGAGGIGAALSTSFSRYEYGTSAAILMLIIAIVIVTEYISGHIRRRIH